MRHLLAIAASLILAACSGGAGGESDEKSLEAAAKEIENKADAEVKAVIDTLNNDAAADEGEGDEPVSNAGAKAE